MAVFKSGKYPLKTSGNNPDGYGNLYGSKGHTLDLRIYGNVLFKVEGEVRKIGTNCCYLSYQKRIMVMIRFWSYRKSKVMGKHFNNKQLAPA